MMNEASLVFLLSKFRLKELIESPLKFLVIKSPLEVLIMSLLLHTSLFDPSHDPAYDQTYDEIMGTKIVDTSFCPEIRIISLAASAAELARMNEDKFINKEKKTLTPSQKPTRRMRSKGPLVPKTPERQEEQAAAKETQKKSRRAKSQDTNRDIIKPIYKEERQAKGRRIAEACRCSRELHNMRQPTSCSMPTTRQHVRSSQPDTRKTTNATLATCRH